MKKIFLLLWLSFIIVSFSQESTKGNIQKSLVNEIEQNISVQPYKIDPRFLLEEGEKAAASILERIPDYFSKMKLEKRNAHNFQIGDKKEWYASDLTLSLTDNGYFYKTASTCRGVGTNCYVFVEDSLWNSRVTQSAVDEIIAGFDNKTPANQNKGIYQTNVETFGNAPDVDNDPKIIIFILNIKDGYKPGGGYTAGYFYSYNQYKNSDLIASGYPAGSNEAELFYLDANPANLLTPAGINEGLNTTAHEFQHMIHFNYPKSATTDGQSTFFNEGCSLVAELVNGYTFREQNRYSKESNIFLFDWRRTNATLVLNDYSRAARFMLYFYDQFGAQFLGKFVQSSFGGIAGMQDALSKVGSSKTFNEIVEDWFTANIVGDKTVNTKYGYDKVENLTKMQAIVYQSPNQKDLDYIKGYGSKYYHFSNSKDLKVKFTTSDNDIKVRAFKKEAKSVIDIPTNTEYDFSDLGTSYDNLYLIVSNIKNEASGVMVSLNSTGAVENEVLELKYDVNPAVGSFSTLYSVNDTLCMVFDKVTTSKIDSIKVQFSKSGKVKGGIYEYTGSSRPTPLGKKIGSIDANITVVSPSIENWQTIDVSSQNISGDKNFVVAFYVFDTNEPRILVSEYTSAVGYRSYTYIGKESTPEWYYINKDDNTIYLNQIRAFVSLPSTNIENDEVLNIPSRFELMQNYPNPFNPSTAISYKLDKESIVKLEIYNLNGSLVKTLVNEVKNTGEHKVIWDGTNNIGSKVASGVYVYRIVAGDKISSRKMIMLK